MEPECSVCRQGYPRSRQEAYLVLSQIVPHPLNMIILEYDVPKETFYTFGGVSFGSRQEAISYCEGLLQEPLRQFHLLPMSSKY